MAVPRMREFDLDDMILLVQFILFLVAIFHVTAGNLARGRRRARFRAPRPARVCRSTRTYTYTNTHTQTNSPRTHIQCQGLPGGARAEFARTRSATPQGAVGRCGTESARTRYLPRPAVGFARTHRRAPTGVPVYQYSPHVTTTTLRRLVPSPRRDKSARHRQHAACRRLRLHCCLP